MLKSLNQPRLSPASPSPRLQQQSRYASSSPQTSTETARRKSYAPESSPKIFAAPLRKVVQYASRGTQYSPMMPKMEDARPDPTLSTTQLPQRTELPPQIAAPVAPTSIPPSPTKPTLKPESPSIKRRQSPGTDQSAVSKNDELAPKRTKSAPAAVKILPVKYEDCPIEDLVVLIAGMIAELIETNDALPRPNPVLTRFHSR